jgi:hypothetical protein
MTYWTKKDAPLRREDAVVVRWIQRFEVEKAVEIPANADLERKRIDANPEGAKMTQHSAVGMESRNTRNSRRVRGEKFPSYRKSMSSRDWRDEFPSTKLRASARPPELSRSQDRRRNVRAGDSILESSPQHPRSLTGQWLGVREWKKKKTEEERLGRLEKKGVVQQGH